MSQEELFTDCRDDGRGGEEEEEGREERGEDAAQLLGHLHGVREEEHQQGRREEEEEHVRLSGYR